MKAKRVRIPTGSRLLGAIVRALDLRDRGPKLVQRMLTDRTVRRHFGGGHIEGSCLPTNIASSVIFGEPTCACAPGTHPELFRPLVLKQPAPPELRRLLATVVHLHATHWDAVVVPALRADPTLLRALARFWTIDVAVKSAALHIAEGGSEDSATEPAWAVANRPPALLQVLATLMGVSSREKLAELVNAKPETLKSWLKKGKRPCSWSTDQVVAAVTTHVFGGQSLLEPFCRLTLNRHYAMASIARDLRAYFDAVFVRELAQVYAQVRSCRIRTLLSAFKERHAWEPVAVLSLTTSSWLMSDDAFESCVEHHAPHWIGDVRRAQTVWRSSFAALPEAPEERLKVIACTLSAEHAAHAPPRRASRRPKAAEGTRRTPKRVDTSSKR